MSSVVPRERSGREKGRTKVGRHGHGHGHGHGVGLQLPSCFHLQCPIKKLSTRKKNPKHCFEPFHLLS